MGPQFALCSDCQAKYEALRFDPASDCVMDYMPLGSLRWLDEHPEGGVVSDYDGRCEQCRTSIIWLACARTQLWRTESVPVELRELWDEARRVLPEWPGFRRLSLDAEQIESLDGMAEEQREIIGVVREAFPNFSIRREKGGLVHFLASGEPVSARRKRWWQFWIMRLVP